LADIGTEMLEKLEFLLALARERHFGRAAEVCGVTQPTLSAGVKQLEETFGVLLVNRGSRFQGFTAEGERTIAITQQEISEMVGMTRESINKQLRVWATRGWVRLEHGAIVVLKAEPLQALIEAGPDDSD
jgi:DNA-binding transcriptional LysR family regulator